jgi:hypothetical protein
MWDPCCPELVARASPTGRTVAELPLVRPDRWGQSRAPRYHHTRGKPRAVVPVRGSRCGHESSGNRWTYLSLTVARRYPATSQFLREQKPMRRPLCCRSPYLVAIIQAGQPVASHGGHRSSGFPFSQSGHSHNSFDTLHYSVKKLRSSQVAVPRGGILGWNLLTVAG